MIIYNPYGKLETNCVFAHGTNHLNNDWRFLGAIEVFKEYMANLAIASGRTNVQWFNHAICPTHPHLLLRSLSGGQSFLDFYYLLDNNFAKRLKNMRDDNNKPYYPGGQAFRDAPYVTPIVSFSQMFEASCYVYHNNDGIVLSRKDTARPFTHWNSSLPRYESGLATPANDILLAVLNITSQQYMTVYNMDVSSRAIFLQKLQSRQDPNFENRLFKVNPDLPYDTDVSNTRFINNSIIPTYSDLHMNSSMFNN